MVIEMNCLICVGAAERVMCDGPCEERDCPECGRYRISDELILSLMGQGQIFDVPKTRRWLDTRRTEGVLLTYKLMKGCWLLTVNRPQHMRK